MEWNRTDRTKTALVIVDPQVDVLASEGALWDLVGDQVERLGVVEKLVSLRDTAEQAGIQVFYSWLRLDDQDYASWTPKSPLQKLMGERQVAHPERGGRFLEALEPTPSTVVLKPRKGPSPAASDLAEQLRQRGIERVVFAGMIANLCLESHVREMADLGFEAVVVGDAIATTDDGTLQATLNNFGLLASGVVESSQMVQSFESAVA